MEYDLSIWLQQVKYERNHFYELNYFTTPQLLGLREELGYFEASDDHRPKVDANIMNLLHGISEDLSSNSIKAVLDSLKIEVPSIPVNPSKAVQSSIENKSSNSDLKNQLSQKEVMKKPVDSTVADEVNDANYPKPKLTVDDLTPDQQSLLYNLEGAGHNKLLILLSFERIAPTSTMLEDVSKWCEKHEDEFDYPEENSDSESTYSEIMSDVDNLDNEDVNEELQQQAQLEEEEGADEDTKLINNSGIEYDEFIGSVEQFCIDSYFEKKIEIKQEIPLDEQHPDVKKLIGLGFESDMAIEAVDKFPNDPGLAMEYIISDSDTPITNQIKSSKQEAMEFEE